jgi:hypothetical protein
VIPASPLAPEAFDVEALKRLLAKAFGVEADHFVILGISVLSVVESLSPLRRRPKLGGLETAAPCSPPISRFVIWGVGGKGARQGLVRRDSSTLAFAAADAPQRQAICACPP